ncbi:hypothetical protein, partial [Mitsuokella jalaludinii]|uniref:hypothetical protein n=1 Tax=Mitsuokella jalaludinii TaxID=187979 RepID=UPI00307A5544
DSLTVAVLPSSAIGIKSMYPPVSYNIGSRADPHRRIIPKTSKGKNKSRAQYARPECQYGAR